MSYTTEKMREYMRLYRQRRLNEAREKLGGKCVRCGSTENLHFDHIDKSTKVCAVTKLLHASAAKFWEEVAKCQLLCEQHHREKSMAGKEYGQEHEKFHGINCYNKRKCRCPICCAAKAVVAKRYYLRHHGEV